MPELKMARRGLLLAAGGLAATAAGRAAASAAIPKAPVRPILLAEPVTYRPYSISDPRALPHFPSDARPVRWGWARSRGLSIQDAMATLQPNDVLVLPEDSIPYEIDTSSGFRRGSQNWYSMAAVKRGIVGLGPGAVIQPKASSFRAGRQTYSGGMQEKMLESRAPGAYFGNFTMYGRDLGGIGYNAIWASGAGTTWEHIYFRGAHRGWLSKPPGEAGAICGYRGADMRIFNCEIDCRDVSGASVGTSPFMFNLQPNVYVADVYAHHALVGMPTYWKVASATAIRMRHENGAQGPIKQSPGVNVESSSGHFVFQDCTFLINYGVNRGLHLNTLGQTSSIRFDIVNPRIDAGPWPGYFSIQESRGPVQLESDFHITRADGSVYPFRIAH